MSRERPRVLVACDAYLPGCKGGSLWSVAHMVARLGDEFDFRIVTGDRDYGDREPYPGIERDRWIERPGARVFYGSARQHSLPALAAQVRSVAPQALYLNSMFSPLAVRLLALRRCASRARRVPVVLMPTGEMAGPARASKRWKKTPFLALARTLGLFTDVLWRATDAREEADLRRVAGARDVRVIAELAPPILPAWTPLAREAKRAGRVRLVYFSRVTPNKNLLFLLEALQHVRAEVDLAVYGPVDDPAYWERCLALAARLPAHVVLRAHGPLPHERVAEMLARFDALALPTLYESFGFVVLEALAAGCPVLISDRTPWQDLDARGAGRVLPLDVPSWTEAVERLAALDAREHQAWRAAARRCAEERAAEPRAEADLRILMRHATAAGGASGAFEP